VSTTVTAMRAVVDQDARRARVRGARGIDGIDFVEVLANRPEAPGHVRRAPRQRTLLVHLLNAPVPADWDASRVLVLRESDAGGSERIEIEWAWPAVAVAGVKGTPAVPDLPGVATADRTLIRAALPDSARSKVLVVRTRTSGDWAPHVLRLLAADRKGAPKGFDPPLAAASFRFTVDCPSTLDCRPDDGCPPATAESPVLDYLARDYEALRTRLLDRLSVLLPDWDDRSPADAGVMLAELFAFVGDRLAYWQDAIAEEAYLGTARRRTSVRRHARLLDYAVHEGCSARTWLAVHTDTAVTLRAGTAVADLVREPGRPKDAATVGGVVFETCSAVDAVPARNEIPLYAWGDPEHCLPAGTTAAFLAPAGGDPDLKAGDVLLLVDRPAGGGAVDGDPARRYAVRLDRDPIVHTDALPVPPVPVLEVSWQEEDALPGALPVSGRHGEGAVALANVVLADHGASVADEALVEPQVTDPESYRPRLPRPGLAWADPPPSARGEEAVAATAALRPDPRRAVPQVELDDGHRVWQPRPDLLGSGRLAAHFVVEAESDGSARLRFGDGRSGRRPTRLSSPRAWYRLGGGQRGNVAAGRLDRVLRLPGGGPAVPDGAGVTIWNPLPATGGTDPEPLEDVRQLAPHAFRHQLRAVVSEDYATVAMREPGVQRAVARRTWAGSWYVQQVAVDAVAARAQDPRLRPAVAARLELRRMAGVDVDVVPPVFVPLEIVLRGCVAPGRRRADVERQLRDALSARVLRDGRRGFFHPDRFTFGQPLFLSDLVAAALRVPGLSWVEATGFSRRGGAPGDTAAALAAGQIDAGPSEVLRCDSDPDDPEAGSVSIVLRGGS
jgi:hypothetical protein